MVKNNILIIDGQVFQNDTFYRGMGRYSLKLLENLLSDKTFINSKYSQTILLLNKNISTDNNKLKAIKKINPQLIIDWIKYPTTNSPISKQDIIVYQKTLDQHINSKYTFNKVTFFILSNFEVFHTLSVFPTINDCTKIELFYDLIPHLFFKQYLQGNDVYIQEYYTRFVNIFQADHIFTISQTTKNDLSSFLNINPTKITNINGALINSIDNTKPNNIIEINNNFFLCDTGDDLRKNNDKTVEAFCNFSQKNNNKYTLIFTSKFSDQSIQKLSELKNSINPKARIEFCGNVSDQQLEYYYQKSIAVICIPTYEGLGLPILKAINNNKIIIASDIPVFREISTSALHYCDPNKIDSVIQSLNDSINDNKIDLTEYNRIKQLYTWDNTIKLFIAGIDSITKRNYTKKIKIALIGPILTGYSAIAKYCEDIYPGLLEYADVDYFYDAGQTIKKYRESYIPYVTGYFDIKDLEKKQYKEYDYFFYNMGNSEFHINIYKKASVFPGVLIIHDGTLAGMFDYALNNNLIETERYNKEKSLQISKTHNFLTSIINSSTIVIVHSQHTYKIVLSQMLYPIKVVMADLPTTFCINETKKFKPITISMAGIISNTKGTNVFIDTIKTLHKKYKNQIIFKIFGYDFNNETNLLKQTLNKYPCEIMSNLSDLEYQNELIKTNILVNFREKYNGETSKSCIDSFRHGIVVIVNNIGWFSEIPDNCAIKINNTKDIVKTISYLIDNPNELKNRSINSQKLVKSKFNTETYIKTIFNYIKKDFK